MIVTEFDKEYNGRWGGRNGENLVPRSVIVIGGTPILAYDYNLITNIELESDSATITYPTDLLNITTMYRNFRTDGRVIPVQIWSGFLDYRFQHFSSFDFDKTSAKSNQYLIDDLLQNVDKYLTLQWYGIVKQFELNFPEPSETDITKIMCSDFSVVLKKYDYEHQYQEDEAKVGNILNNINSKMKNFKFIVDPDLPQSEIHKIKQFVMGYETKYKEDGSESEKSEIKYTTTGKSYYDILKEIAEDTRTTIVPDIERFNKQDVENEGKLVYMLTRRMTSAKGWRLYRNQHFNNLNIRSGEFGGSPSAKIAIKVWCDDTENAGEKIEGTFPKNLPKADAPEGQHLFIFKTKPGTVKTTLEGIAEDVAKQIAQDDITGDMMIPNAIIGLKVKHQLQLRDGTELADNRSVSTFGEDVNYVVNSITQDYGLQNDTLSQKVEFCLDLNTTNIINSNGEFNTINKMKLNEKKSDLLKYRAGNLI
jgi:hypothetical protein